MARPPSSPAETVHTGLALFLFALCTALSACHDMTAEMESLIGTEYHTVNPTAAVSAYSGEERTIPSGTFAGNSFKPFVIARYQTTYGLWQPVRIWAENHGYTFDHPGTEGGGENSGAPSLAKYKPVAAVSWWDCILWCNAYSEQFGRTPVYYSDGDYTAVLRSRLDGGGKEHSVVYVKAESSGNVSIPCCTADGWRLPSAAEWMWAAKGGDPSAEDWSFPYSGGKTAEEVAVFGRETMAAVGTKKPNRLGLYDMSGNVWEWINGTGDENLTANLLGGSYGSNEQAVRLSNGIFNSGLSDDTAFGFFGFRIARNQ